MNECSRDGGGSLERGLWQWSTKENNWLF
jgi:hypothetical protein